MTLIHWCKIEVSISVWSVFGWSVVKCSEVLQCSDGLSNKVSSIIKRHTDNMKLLLICTLLLSHSFIFNVRIYMVASLFNTVIYVFLLLCLIVCLCTYCMFAYLFYVYVFIVCLCIFIVPAGTLRLPWREVFPCFFLSCKANARVKPAKVAHGPHSS
jgi:hypothetical protein